MDVLAGARSVCTVRTVSRRSGPLKEIPMFSMTLAGSRRMKESDRKAMLRSPQGKDPAIGEGVVSAGR
jgi:hypothetical protein